MFRAYYRGWVADRASVHWLTLAALQGWRAYKENHLHAVVDSLGAQAA